MDEQMLDAEPSWHPAQQVHDEIMLRLAALMRLGYCEQASIEADPRGYLRIVCGTLAGCVASMPCVQRAMKAAYPNLSIEEQYRAVVLAVAQMLTVEGEELLKGQLKPRRVEPQLDLLRPPGPVN
jgi:hypothetical protein